MSRLFFAVSVIAAATMYRLWTVADNRYTHDSDEAAAAAYRRRTTDVGHPRTRDEYLPKLRSLMTRELAAAYETKFLTQLPWQERRPQGSSLPTSSCRRATRRRSRASWFERNRPREHEPSPSGATSEFSAARRKTGTLASYTAKE